MGILKIDLTAEAYFSAFTLNASEVELESSSEKSSEVIFNDP